MSTLSSHQSDANSKNSSSISDHQPGEPKSKKELISRFFCFLFPMQHKITLITLIISIAALSLVLQQSLKQKYFETKTIEFLDQVDQHLSVNQGKISQSSQQVDQHLQEDFIKLQNEQAELSKANIALRESIKELGASPFNSQDDSLIAEARYLVRMANQRLLLIGDPETTAKLIELADKRLAETHRTNLTNVRQILAQDIVALKAVKEPDIEGIWLRITALNEAIRDLPQYNIQQLETTSSESKEETSTLPTKTLNWHQSLASVWAQFSDLIKIRRHDVPIQPLLSAQEQTVVMNQISFQLESAKWALVSGKEKIFQESLSSAQKLLDHYYNQNENLEKTLAKQLTELEHLSIKPTYPSLNASLSAIEALHLIKHSTLNTVILHTDGAQG